jgi:anti-sigma factor ChrR (cupin superfamily)
MEDFSIIAADVPWEQVTDHPHKMSRKVLRTGPGGAPRVALIRLEAGFDMDAHSHAHAENHYVLEGMYESQGREHPAGSYRYVPRHSQHGPFRSPSGAVLLVVWED